MEKRIEIWGVRKESIPSQPDAQITKGSLGKECDYLSKFVPTIFGLFQWFGADADDERICTLQYLGYKLHRALDVAVYIYNNRNLVIRDEQCDVFQHFLSSINNRVKNIEKFINTADDLLKRAFDENSSILDFGKKRLISKFKPLMEWLDEIKKDTTLKKLVMEKCEEWELNHNISIYDDVSGDFRRQTYALLDSMILLSIPSHVTASLCDFTALYQNTFHAFRQSEKWQTRQNFLEAQIKEEYDDQELTTKKQKEQHLKDKYYKLKIAKKNFLKKFGIKYIGIKTDWGKGYLGQKLYERLNNIHLSLDEDAKFVKMQDADLGAYLMIEAQMQYLTEKIEKLKTKKDGQSTIFLEMVDEDILSSCFFEVHQKFFGNDACLILSGTHKDEAALISFLFMVVEKDKLVKSNFFTSGKKPFYEFFTIESAIPIKCTEKTFYNRLTKNFGEFRKALMSDKPIIYLKSELYSDFQLVRTAFHGTKKYNYLKRCQGE